MTPQERDLLTQLIDRLRAAPPQQKDPEAEQLIRDAVRLVPDAPYLLAQTVLMQDFALNQAQQRIQDLERRVAQPAAQGGGSFLGGLFGGGASRPQPPAAAGPWGGAPQGPGQQQAQPQGQPQPQYAAPPAQAFAPQGQQPSFLRSAATTAVGIAGGALLFQGLSSMFGGHQGFAQAATPGLGETVVNNYYGDSAGGADTSTDRFADDPSSGSDSSSNWDTASSDDSFDSGGGDDWA
ncbi:MAG: putative periplasmic ligand-binding sensor protein [Rhodospirillales bacterium]|nr:putative periplasmic ligand-binding sensor protein [Rhodospirillales bacterium]